MLPSPGDFVLDRASRRIGIKSALMEYAGLERGFPVTRWNRRVITVEAPNVDLAFTNMNGFRSSQVGRFFCDKKEQARARLAGAGLSVAPSELFAVGDQEKAWEYSVTLGSAVVVKPTSSARGNGITTQISTREQFEAAWKKAFSVYRNDSLGRVLVEKQILGEDYRFYVIGNKHVFCTHRKRANVTGDGVSTLSQLIAEKNSVRAQNPYLGAYLIPPDPKNLDRLPLHGWKLSHVPAEGEVIELRGASNLSAGGDSIDYTELMHPGFRDLVIRAVEATPGMEYAGVDIIAPSITVAPNQDNHVIGEVEYSPAPITHFPVSGKVHDMAGALLDYYLAEYQGA